MALQNVSDIHRVIRDRVFSNLWPDTGISFDLNQAHDAGPEQFGELFNQNKQFMVVEVRIDEVVKSGPGVHSPNRVYGALELSYQTKDRLDMVGANHLLEKAGNWFAQKTIDGVRFREFIPTGSGHDMGFQFYSGTVIFEYETTNRH